MDDTNHFNPKRERHRGEGKIQTKWLTKKRLEQIRERVELTELCQNNAISI